MATDETWALLAQQWEQALDSVQINAFHAADLESGTGEFKKWKDLPDQRTALLTKLIAILRRHDLIYLLASEPVYKTADDNITKRAPYCDCLVAILESVAHHVRTLDRHTKIEIVFAESPGQSSWVREIFPQVKYLVGDLNLICDTYHVSGSGAPLQVADLVLFELCKERERLAFRRTDNQRWVLNEMLRNPFYWNGYFRPPLVEGCHQCRMAS